MKFIFKLFNISRFIAVVKNGTRIDFDETKLKWRWGEPNGHHVEQCSVLLGDQESVLLDVMCLVKYRTSCFVENIPDFLLQNLDELMKQGLPKIGPEFVTKFGKGDPDKFQLKGFTDHMIEFNKTSWNLLDLEGNVILTCLSDDVPFGLRSWVSPKGNEYLLNVNTCNTAEFSCDDGMCLDRFSRCNQIPDCQNAEDEEKCKYVDIPTSYNRLVPIASSKQNLDLTVDVKLRTMVTINPAGSTFTMHFRVLTSWSDERLTFINLQVGDNIMSFEEWQKIWTPSFIIKHTKTFTESSYLSSEKESFVYLRAKNSSVFISKYDRMHNNFLYNGKNVEIYKNNKYTIDFTCDFNWRYYPFDTQICHMILQPISVRAKQIKLILNVESEVVEYSTFSIKMLNSSVGMMHGEPNMIVNLMMKRDFTPLALNTFLPTFLLTVINQLTNYYHNVNILEGVIAINATILMTLGSIFISTFNSVPPSTYIKMIDIWMIVVLIYPCIIIASHTIMFRMTGGLSKRSGVVANLMQRILKVLLPCLFLIFAVGYWIVGLKIYHMV